MDDMNRETNRNGYQKQLSVGKVWATINGHNTLTISPLAPISTEQIDSTLIISSPETKAHMENFANPHRVTQDQLGLGNVENKDSATIRSEITPTDISNSLGYVPATRQTATNVADGLMSKEDKIKMDGIDSTWSGTVHSVDSGIGLVGGPITNNGTLKLKLRSEQNQTNDTVNYYNVVGRQYPVGVDHSGFVSVNVPWTDTTYPIVDHTTDGRMTKEDKIKLDGIQDHSEENQNAFSIVQVDDKLLSSSAKMDKFTITTGHNIILTPNTATNSVNIAAVDTTYDPATQNVHGLMSKEDKKKLDSIAYGECSTAAGTAAKVVTIVKSSTIEDWRLVKGSRIQVKFTNNNTAANVTLNVGSTGAKPIKQYGTTGDFQTYTWQAGSILEFVYDGTNFLLVGGSQATTSAYGMTKLNSAHDSSSEVLAATPKAVKDTYDMAFKKLDKITIQATAPVSVSGDTTLDSTKKTGTITITHDTSQVTAGNYGTAGTTEVKPAFGGTFSVISASVTDKGHVSKMEHHNVKIPTLSVSNLITSGAKIGTITINGDTVKDIYQYSKLVLGNSSASTNAADDVEDPYIRLYDNTIYSSQVQLDGTNPIIIKGKNGVVSFTHKESNAITDNSSSMTKGLSAAATPGFGSSFYVPNVTIDRTGHVTDLNHYSVTVPSPTISATITEGATIGTIKINDTTTTFKQKTHLYLGASNATANATSDVDNPYIRLFDNTTPSDSVRVVGSSPIIAKGDNGAITISHATYTARTSTVTDKSPGFGGTFTVDALTSNGNGHVTALTAKTITLPTLTASNANSNAGSDIGTVTINGNAVTFKHPKALSTAQTTAALYNVKINTDGHITEATKVTAGTNISLDSNKITNTYTHPISAAGAKSSGLYKITTDANGHVTAATAATKSDLSLGNVENKSSATIRGELTSSNVTTALGYTPIDKAIGTAKGDIIYFDASSSPKRLGIGSNGQVLKVNSSGIPAWATDNNTTYSAGTGLSLSGTTFSNSGVTGIKLGSSTAASTGVVTVSPSSIGAATSNHDHDSTYAAKTHSHDVATSSAKGFMSAGDKNIIDAILNISSQGHRYVRAEDVILENNGRVLLEWKSGSTTKQTSIELSASDGNAVEISRGLNVAGTIKQNGTAVSLNGHSHDVATTSANGFMSSDMVTKLNGIATGATANTGTVTAVKINGTTKNPTNGVVDLGTIATSSGSSYSLATSDTMGIVYLSGGSNSYRDDTAPTTRLLKDLLDTKADYSHTHSQYLTSHQSLSGYVPTTRKVGGVALSSDITINGNGGTTVSVSGSAITISSPTSTGSGTVSYSAGTGISISGTTISNSGVTGVKGNSETSYRTGNVNITATNIGLGNVDNKSSATIRSEITSSNVTTALGYTPSRSDHTHSSYAASSHTHALDSSSITGVLPISKGGTGNSDGYIRTGQKSGSTIGSYATAEGFRTAASAMYSHAEGYDTTAYNISSHAEGHGSKTIYARFYLTKPCGYNSTSITGIVIGTDNYLSTFFDECGPFYLYTMDSEIKITRAQVNGVLKLDTEIGRAYSSGAEFDILCKDESSDAYPLAPSHVEGYATTATRYSHAEGYYTCAYGECSHAEGYYTCAYGEYSHAGGFRTLTTNTAQTAIGQFNKNINLPDKITNSENWFTIGAGTSDSNRANAFRVGSTQSWAAGTMNSSGADYAELFEWKDGNPDDEDRRGRFVTLDGEFIRLIENESEFILGIVSGFPTVLGDVYDDQYHGMYESDVFGTPIYEDAEVPAEIMKRLDPETGEEKEVVIREAHIECQRKLNPNYDSSIPYKPRTQRPEWSPVGMMGKLVCLDDGSAEANGWVKPSEGGIATKSEEKTKYRVMKRLDENHIKVLILP